MLQRVVTDSEFGIDGLCRHNRLLQGLCSAQSTTGAADQVSPPLLERSKGFGRDCQLDLDALINMADLAVEHLLRCGNDTLRQTEPKGKILEVSRCRHHYDMRDTVVDQRHWSLHCDMLAIFAGRAALPQYSRDLGGCINWQGYRRASSNSPRCLRSNDCCRACQFDGLVTLLICTAVTLYSGQLVAQSLLSVVITLAPDTG